MFPPIALFFLTPIPNLQGAWLASLAGSQDPERRSKEASGLLASEAQPSETWAGWATPPYSWEDVLPSPAAPSAPELCTAAGRAVSPGLGQCEKEPVSAGVRMRGGAGAACRSLWACVKVHKTVFPDIFLKTHSEGGGEALRERSSLCFLWNENSSSCPQKKKAHLPLLQCAGQRYGDD